jgi:hypothetical protein
VIVAARFVTTVARRRRSGYGSFSRSPNV